AVANAGGVARAGDVGFYDASDPAALESALDEITHSLGCQVELQFAPQEFLDIVITVDGSRIPQLQSCKDSDEPGWVQIDPIHQPKKIELCNTACDDAEIGGGTAKICPLVP